MHAEWRGCGCRVEGACVNAEWRRARVQNGGVGVNMDRAGWMASGGRFDVVVAIYVHQECDPLRGWPQCDGFWSQVALEWRFVPVTAGCACVCDYVCDCLCDCLCDVDV